MATPNYGYEKRQRELAKKKKKEDKLRAKVNEIVADAKKSGDLDKLAVKWLGRPAGDLPQ